MLSIRCRLIIILSIYVWLTLILAKVYPYSRLITDLFAIWCGINQAVTNPNVKHIVVITDSLHIARKIFDSSTHPYQIHSAAISIELREFFSKDSQNHIKFWNYSSKQQWILHQLVNKETKNIVSTLLFPCKSSWNFCKKSECESILS